MFIFYLLVSHLLEELSLLPSCVAESRLVVLVGNNQVADILRQVFYRCNPFRVLFIGVLARFEKFSMYGFYRLVSDPLPMDEVFVLTSCLDIFKGLSGGLNLGW